MKKGLTFYSKPLKYLAERGRFELPVVLPTHDFQSCSLDQLGHLSVERANADTRPESRICIC